MELIIRQKQRASKGTAGEYRRGRGNEVGATGIASYRQGRADSADGIGEILRATVHSEFEENNQYKNMISIMM